MGLFHYQIAIALLSIYLKTSSFLGNNKPKKLLKGQKNWQINLSNLSSEKKHFGYMLPLMEKQLWQILL